MAGNKRVQGITIEIGGDTKGLDTALRKVNKTVNETQAQLKDVKKLLKFDPGNTELLAQKQQLLKKAVGETTDRLEQLKDAEKQLKDAGVDENGAQFQSLRREIIETENSLDNLKDAANESNVALEKIGATADKVASGAQKVADATAGISRTAQAGLAAAAAATVKIVDSYADYEQLIGGVETLFKGDADALVARANDAYKTAGLSANDYMETATGFAASLVSSLGGDTKKAVDLADMAITDMSDNANKMGSDMSSIQNAYQGFAKQNYTMLDNLKLGYGGTKEEMQRLIDDANALNAAQGNYTSYTIDSYADIVDAIHTVQTEMGITGTTALEASTTVEGSVNSMKSAWSNFVTGLGSDNADISALSAQLIESVGTVAENVLPVVETVLKNIAEAVSNDGPEMIEQFVSYAIEKLPEIIKLGLQMVLALVKGLVQNLPELWTAVLDMTAGIAQTILDALPDIIEVGRDIVRGVWEGIKAMASWIGEKVSGFFSGIVGDVKDALGIHSPSRVFAGIGENMALGLGQGFASEMKSIGAGIQNAIPTPTVDAVYNAAAGMVNGFAAANSGGGSYTINLVLQNGQQIASWLLPDLRDAARNNPEVATA